MGTSFVLEIAHTNDTNAQITAVIVNTQSIYFTFIFNCAWAQAEVKFPTMQQPFATELRGVLRARFHLAINSVQLLPFYMYECAVDCVTVHRWQRKNRSNDRCLKHWLYRAQCVLRVLVITRKSFESEWASDKSMRDYELRKPHILS